MSRVQKFGNAGMTVLTVMAIVVVQGILAYHFRVFRYFDLQLIYCVYYGFTMSRPVASVFLGGGLGFLQDSLSGGPWGPTASARP